MQLSIIIPCRNGADSIGGQLEALANQVWEQPWEIIVADNGSTDSSLQIVEKFRPRLPGLRIIDASARPGQPYALNQGAAHARGESLAFCDADDVAGSSWVGEIGKALAKHDLVASRFEFSRLNEPDVASTRRNEQSEGLQAYRNPPFLPHAGGCGLGVKRRLFEEAGGFDEKFPALHDTDFCWKLQLQGVKLHFAADAVMHVRFRDSLRGCYRQARAYGQYNVLLYKRYRSLGMPPALWTKGLAAWASLVWQIPRLQKERTRLHWARSLGLRVGRARGCLRYRTFAP